MSTNAKSKLVTVGNVYLDTNVHGVRAGEPYTLNSGKDYFADSAKLVLGGSAINFAMQSVLLGSEVSFAGKTGDDENARIVRRLLDSSGIDSSMISTDPNRSTSMAINLVSISGEFIGVHYGDASKSLKAEDINLGNEFLDQSQAVYFGGTAKQPLLFKDCELLFRDLNKRGIKVFYDPNRFPAEETHVDIAMLPAQFTYVEGYFPNEEEILQATNESDIDMALDKVLSYGVKFVALKLGAKGCRVKTLTEDFTVEGHEVSVVTTVGAGDCFNATFIAYYLQGEDLRKCATLATKAASIKVSKDVWPDSSMLA